MLMDLVWGQHVVLTVFLQPVSVNAGAGIRRLVSTVRNVLV